MKHTHALRFMVFAYIPRDRINLGINLRSFFIVTLFLSEDMARDYLFTGRFLCLVSELRILDVASNLFVYRLF